MSGRIETRVENVEHAIQLLTKNALRADERMDSADERMNSFDDAMLNLTIKIEALADAQIRTEVALAHLAEAQAHLADPQTHRRTQNKD